MLSVVAADFRQPAVNHHPDPRDSEACLGNVGRKNHLPEGGGGHHLALRLRGHFAVKGQHGEAFPVAGALKFLGRMANLPRARKEYEDVARSPGIKQVAESVRNRLVEIPHLRAPGIGYLDRVDAAIRTQNRTAGKILGDPGRVQGGAHYGQAQLPEGTGLEAPRHGKPKVRIESALVEFVEDNCPAIA